MSLSQILRDAASGGFAHYRPQPVMAAVNALLPLGKAGALARIEAYVAGQPPAADPQTGLFLVLRTLFAVPAEPGHHPAMRLGGASPPPPADPESLPHFPLVVIDDRPLLLVQGFVLGGVGESVSAHIRHYRATGTLRGQALAPTQPPDGVLSQFQAIFQRAYGRAPLPHEVAFIESQLAAPCLHGT